MPQRLAAVRTVISRLREAWEGRAPARPLTGKAAFQAAGWRGLLPRRDNLFELMYQRLAGCLKSLKGFLKPH